MTSDLPPRPRPATAEHRRLAESADAADPWRRWGPYVAGRQWGTVREDYSAAGSAWDSFPFDHAYARAYRWGEDGLGAVCDRFGFVNLGLALWNGRDPILKERLFGLTNDEGNHGEDVKEHFWALDCTPTHSWMQWLYRYPQAAYPYEQLREENAARGRDEREFELADTGVLDGNRFFDVLVSYAKASPDDLLMTVSATNHGPDPAPLELIPQLWLRNTWGWGRDERRTSIEPLALDGEPGLTAVRLPHEHLGVLHLAAEGAPEVVFCDNETNRLKLFGTGMNASRYTKDGINDHVVHGARDAVTHRGGSKVGFRYTLRRGGARGHRHGPAAAAAGACRTRTTFGDGYDGRASRASLRGRRVLRHRHPPRARRRRHPRRPARLRRAALGQAAVPLRRASSGWRATRPSPPPAPARRQAGRPQPALAAPVAGRRHLDAR